MKHFCCDQYLCCLIKRATSAMPHQGSNTSKTSGTPLDNIDCPVEILNEQVVHQGQWTRTIKSSYRIKKSGEEKISESIHRKTPKLNRPHGVEVIATLHKCNKTYFVFIKEYRMPLAGYCFEFPAGLLDDNETIVDAAKRELKEETGYTASKVECLSIARHPLAAQMTDNSICYAFAEIDGDSAQNQNPKPVLEESEVIEVVEVECTKALAYVQSISDKVHVDGMVYAFLLGYTFTT